MKLFNGFLARDESQRKIGGRFGSKFITLDRVCVLGSWEISKYFGWGWVCISNFYHDEIFWNFEILQKPRTQTRTKVINFDPNRPSIISGFSSLAKKTVKNLKKAPYPRKASQQFEYIDKFHCQIQPCPIQNHPQQKRKSSHRVNIYKFVRFFFQLNFKHYKNNSFYIKSRKRKSHTYLWL